MLSDNTKRHLKKLQQKKYREEFGEFTIESVKGVQEAIENEAEVRVIVAEQKFFEPEMKQENSEVRELVEMAQAKNIAVEFASQKETNEIKTTETFPGILAMVKKPIFALNNFDQQSPIICLDGVKDPGNMGTIIRTADWFGIKNILLSEDCVDPYNEKVVRSTMGSIFRTQIVESKNLQHDLEALKKQQYIVVGLQMNGESVFETELKKKTIFVFGSESHGISTEIQKLLDTSCTIPKVGQAESLNVGVAVGVVLAKISF